jgi:hypothetical protein
MCYSEDMGMVYRNPSGDNDPHRDLERMLREENERKLREDLLGHLRHGPDPFNFHRYTPQATKPTTKAQARAAKRKEAAKAKLLRAIKSLPKTDNAQAAEHIRAANPLLKFVTTVVALLGGILFIGGCALAFADKFAATRFILLGSTFTSSSVGVSMVFIGAVMLISVFRRLFKLILQLGALPPDKR